MILIVGAGIAGLSLAHQLQRLGTQVTVLEAGTLAQGASGVATSYLEPRLGDTPMRIMEREALSRWTDYAAMLENASGIDVGFQTNGQLRVTIEEYAHKFEKDLRLREQHGGTFERLTAAETRKLEPELSPHIVAGAFLPDVRWVTGRLVCAALENIVLANGGKILTHTAVMSFENRDGMPNAVLKDGTKLKGHCMVLCTGMGANQIQGLPDDIPHSRPVRGVNLVADMSSMTTPLSRLIKHHRGNLCPRADGRLIIGTTYEADEHSLDVHEDVVDMLYTNAEPVLPNVRNLRLLGIHAGIRAKVGDGLLRLGCSQKVPNLYYSLSHAGTGFLRAPVIAEEFARYIAEGTPGDFTHSMTKGPASRG